MLFQPGEGPSMKLREGLFPAAVSVQTLCYAACYPLIHITRTGADHGCWWLVGLQPTPPPVTRPVSAVLSIAKLFSFPSLAILVSLHY